MSIMFGLNTIISWKIYFMSIHRTTLPMKIPSWCHFNRNYDSTDGINSLKQLIII